MGKKYFLETKMKTNLRIFERSILPTKDIKKGQKFTKYNVRVVRPGYGLARCPML